MLYGFLFWEGFSLKSNFSNLIKHLSVILILIMIAMITVSFPNKISGLSSNVIMCNLDEHSLYPNTLNQILPSFDIKQSENKVYYYLEEGFITEAFNTQAMGALDTGLAKYWYPHYLATVVIAVDKDQTDVKINSWNDLLSANEEVSFSNNPGDIQMLLAAMSYGLEGNNYTMKKAIELLSSLNKKNHLKINSFSSPIIICYDYQAAAQIDHGRNIEIIIPSQGTITYEKGLLSNIKINFEDNLNNLLIEGHFRTLNEQSDLSVYPEKSKYLSAVKISNIKYFAKMTRDNACLFERKVLNSRRYMSIDNREHIHFALIYIIIIAMWTISVIRRSMQKGISYSAFITGILLAAWTLVRLIKYQNEAIPTLTRYLWYSFYIFQLSLPLVMLWMAWAIDKPEDKTFPPKWWRYLAVLAGILIIFVFTNDIHNQVFKLDLDKLDWGINYSYGFGYYIILFVCIINLVAVFLIMIIKSIKNPRKMGFIFPFIIFVLFISYTYKYIIRDPFIYQTDLTIVTGIFTMLMFEASIHSGLIPVNSKYIDLFTNSPLKIQIYNSDGTIALASKTSEVVNSEILEKLMVSSSEPVLQNDDFILLSNAIPGGFAVWQEDIKKLHQLHNEIKLSTQMITQANAMLADEEKLKRAINEQNEKKKLLEQLENEIAQSTIKLSKMIDKLSQSGDNSNNIATIALLVCFIKRRCNLFFLEKEMDTIDISEIIVYLDEISDITMYSNLQIARVHEVNGDILIRYATLFYDFFYEVIDLAVQSSCQYLIEHLIIEDDFIMMRFLAPLSIGEFNPEITFKSALEAAHGKIITKDLDDSISISISFPKGGIIYD